MDLNRVMIGLAVAVAVGAAVLSGPAFSGATPTPATEADTGELGYGSAEIAVVSTPDTVRLTDRDDRDGGEAGHDLRVPPATVRVESVERRPALVYKLRVPDLGYVRSTTLFLDADSEGRQRLTIDGGSLSHDLDRERYEGELLVAVRSGTDQRVLERRNVTVVVE